MNTTLTYSKYNLNTAISLGTEYEDKSTDLISLGYLSGIRDYAAKIDFDYVPSPRHFIRFGTNVIFHEFNPGQFNLEQISVINGINFKQTLGQPIKNATEMAMYVEDDFEITKKLKVNLGLHLSGFSVDDAFYTSLQPRFSARYLLPKGIGLKASFATMRQFINLLSFEGIGLVRVLPAGFVRDHPLPRRTRAGRRNWFHRLHHHDVVLEPHAIELSTTARHCFRIADSNLQKACFGTLRLHKVCRALKIRQLAAGTRSPA